MELDVMQFTQLSIEGSTSGDWGKGSRFCKVIWREFDPVRLRKWTGLLQLLDELDPCPSWLVKVTQEEIHDWIRVIVNSFLREGGSVSS